MSVSSDRVTIDAADLEKLNEKDKAELRQFFAGEQKRNRVWAQTHDLTGICWKKCVSSVRSNKLDSSERSCMANCVDRFLDATLATVAHVRQMQQQEGGLLGGR